MHRLRWRASEEWDWRRRKAFVIELGAQKRSGSEVSAEEQQGQTLYGCLHLILCLYGWKGGLVFLRGIVGIYRSHRCQRSSRGHPIGLDSWPRLLKRSSWRCTRTLGLWRRRVRRTTTILNGGWNSLGVDIMVVMLRIRGRVRGIDTTGSEEVQTRISRCSILSVKMGTRTRVAWWLHLNVNILILFHLSAFVFISISSASCSRVAYTASCFSPVMSLSLSALISIPPSATTTSSTPTRSPRCKDSFNVSTVLCIHFLRILGGILSSMNALPSPLSCLSPISSESDDHGEKLRRKCECDRMWP